MICVCVCKLMLGLYLNHLSKCEYVTNLSHAHCHCVTMSYYRMDFYVMRPNDKVRYVVD